MYVRIYNMRKYLKIDHPLSNKKRLKESRYILFESDRFKVHLCHWCGMILKWRVGKEQSKYQDSLCVDHLDRNESNNILSNLVPSCRQCNANRHKNGRRKKINCGGCGKEFLPLKRDAVYCSISCSSKFRKKREISSLHGSRSRYMTGCRCEECRESNRDYWKKWYYKNKTSKYSHEASRHCWDK